MSHLTDFINKAALRSATVPGICRRAKPGDIVYAIRKAAVTADFIPEAAHLIHTVRVMKDTKCGIFADHLTDEPGRVPIEGNGAFMARSLYMIFSEYSTALDYAAGQVDKALAELVQRHKHAAAVLADLRRSMQQELLNE